MREYKIVSGNPDAAEKAANALAADGWEIAHVSSVSSSTGLLGFLSVSEVLVTVVLQRDRRVDGRAEPSAR